MFVFVVVGCCGFGCAFCCCRGWCVFGFLCHLCLVGLLGLLRKLAFCFLRFCSFGSFCSWGNRVLAGVFGVSCVISWGCLGCFGSGAVLFWRVCGVCILACFSGGDVHGLGICRFACRSTCSVSKLSFLLFCSCPEVCWSILPRAHFVFGFLLGLRMLGFLLRSGGFASFSVSFAYCM